MSRNRAGIASLLFVIVGFGYPVLAYLGLRHFSAMAVGLVAIAFLIARALIRPARSALGSLLPVLAVPAVMLAVILPIDDVLAVTLYPVAISLSVAVAFGVSLLYPPTVVERIARVMEPNLNERGVRYTRAVTKLWVAVLLINAAVSAWTAVFASLEVWTLYNGLLSYLFMGAVFAAEFVNRQRVKASHVAASGEVRE